jgi:glycosyltransferase involved in cell wall biosynthesis
MTVPGRVTIIIPTINRSKFAVRAVRGALGQTYRDIELIVSDDASTDDTIDRLREIQDPRLLLFEQKTRLGIIGNPDFCLTKASGEFCLMMGDDDLLLPTAIARLVEPFLRAQSSSAPYLLSASWCPCIVTDAEGTQLWITEGGPEFESPSLMLAEMFAGNRGPRCSSILLRTADSLAVGGLQLKYGDLADIGNWGRAALRGNLVTCIQEPLVQYTMHQGSTTSRSPIEKWQNWARLVHSDLLIDAREHGDARDERKLRVAKRNFISGITLTILIQTIGRPRWIRDALMQSFRTPGAFFTPYMFRRLLKDGKKVAILKRGSRAVTACIQ